ncbi:hypothetical protein [Photobacterium lipolyticum]|nr:hypothetical protein [Photobacterium lipolyticum]
MKRLRHHSKGTAMVLSCFGPVLEQQIADGLVRLRAPETEVCCG